MSDRWVGALCCSPVATHNIHMLTVNPSCYLSVYDPATPPLLLRPNVAAAAGVPVRPLVCPTVFPPPLLKSESEFERHIVSYMLDPSATVYS